MNRTESLKFVEQLGEIELTQGLLIPLFQSMGFKIVDYTHGYMEYGRDIILVDRDEFGKERIYAVLIKGGRKLCVRDVEILTGQIMAAYHEPFSDLIDQTVRKITEIIVIAPNGFSNAAKGRLCYLSKDTRYGISTSFIDGIHLLDLIDKNLPNNFLSNIKREIESERIIKEEKSTYDLIEMKYYRLKAETDPIEKGKLMENVVSYIFSLIYGFKVIKRIRTSTEEIDIVIRNEAKEKFWEKQGLYILAECKNTESKVGKNEIVIFRDKLDNRFNRCDLGFLFSMNGFTKNIEKDNLRNSKGELLVVPIDGEMLERLINSNNVSELLKEYVDTEVFQ